MTSSRLTRVKMVVGGIGVAFALLAGIRVAHAATYAVNGATCNPVQGSASLVTYDSYGIQNTSSGSTASVVCPIPTVQGATFNSPFQINVYDRSSAGNVSCSLFTQNTSGTPTFIQTIQSSGTPGYTQISFSSFGSTAYGGVLECSIPYNTGSGNSYITSILYTHP